MLVGLAMAGENFDAFYFLTSELIGATEICRYEIRYFPLHMMSTGTPPDF